MTTKKRFFDDIKTMQPFLRNNRMRKVTAGVVVWGVVIFSWPYLLKNYFGDENERNKSDLPIYAQIHPTLITRPITLSDESAQYVFTWGRDFPVHNAITQPIYRDYWRWNGFQILDASNETKEMLIRRAREWSIKSVISNKKWYINHSSPYTGYDVKKKISLNYSNYTHDKLRILLALNEYKPLSKIVYQVLLNSNMTRSELLVALNENPKSVAKLYERLREKKMTYDIVSKGLTVSTKMFGYAAAQYQSVDLLRHYGCVTEANRMEKAFRLEDAYIKTERYMAQGVSFKEAGVYGDVNFKPLPSYKYKEEAWDKGFPQIGDPNLKTDWKDPAQWPSVYTENTIFERHAIPYQNAIVASISPQCKARLKSF